MPGLDVRRLTKREIFDKLTALQIRKLDMVISLEDIKEIDLEIQFYRNEFSKRLAIEFLENI